MSNTHRSGGRRNGSTRVRTPKPDKVAAKEYVNKIKELQIILQEIQKRYRDEVNKTRSDNDIKKKLRQDKMNLEFPELPRDNISKHIKPDDRWKIVDAVILWWRLLDEEPNIDDEYYARVGAFQKYSLFKNIMADYLNSRQMDTGFLIDIPQVNYGEARPNFSSPYGFPQDIGTGTPPRYMTNTPIYSGPPPIYSGPPPTYTRGGKRHKSRKYKRSNKCTRSNKCKRTSKYT